LSLRLTLPQTNLTLFLFQDGANGRFKRAPTFSIRSSLKLLRSAQVVENQHTSLPGKLLSLQGTGGCILGMIIKQNFAGERACHPKADKPRGLCQCGAVHVIETGQATWSGVCHCTQCQKMSGSAFMAFVSFHVRGLMWGSVEPARFKSSDLAERLFCSTCGTAVGMQYLGDDVVSLCWGFLTEDARQDPSVQLFAEEKTPWANSIESLDEQCLEEALSNTARQLLR